jgi:membrane-associated phospholipid phosphatase
MSRIIFLVLFLFSFLPASFAQVELTDSNFINEVDSIIAEFERTEQQKKVEKVIQSYNETRLKKEMSFQTDGALHLVRGLLLSWTDHSFITHDARFDAKGDACNWSDYGVAGVPLLANWALKAAGVKSRSKTERMLTANAMAFGISFGATELLKHTIDEGRPDQSDLHSFPSGHTSFAFASATILNREYGYISPWIAVGGYMTAAGTEFLRVNHNKHWMNDLYMGAGIGVMSTNLAYFLTDKIFGEKGINKPELRKRDVLRLMKFNEKATGFSFIMGTEIGDRSIRFEDARVKTGAAVSAGADMTWFVTPKVAVELMTRAVDAQAKVYDTKNVFSGGHLNLYHFDLGGKLSTPFTLGQRLSTRAFAGVRLVEGDTFTDGTKSYTISDETKFEMGLGITYECLDSHNYAWGFTCDYYHTFSSYMKNRYSISSSWKILF